MHHLFAEYTAPRGGGKEPISLDAERRRRRPRRLALGKSVGVEVAMCKVCGAPIDDDEGGLYNLDDMRDRGECRDRYCPF